jgi:hypothetical protein
MKQSLGRLLAWLSLLALALAACTFPVPGTPIASSSGLRVWLDQPPDGGTLPVGTFTLRAHARDAGGSGVQTITFLVSSGGPPVTVGSVTTDPTQPLVMAEFEWNASLPGDYAIQAQAFDREGYVFSAAAHVCVGAHAADGVCAVAGTPAVGFKLQGLVMTDLNADGNATGAGEGPLAGVHVTLSGCDSQSALTNLASSDPAFPEGVFAFGVASLSGCFIEVAAGGWTFESMEGSTAYPMPWPADENPHTILMRPSGQGGSLIATATQTVQGPTATSTKPGQAQASATPTKSAGPTKTPRPGDSQTPTATKTALPSDTPKPSDTPQPSDTPKPTDTQPAADTNPPAIDKVSAAPNPTFYGSSCTKDQAQFTASANVSDPSGVASVTLFYRYGTGGSSGAWQSAVMSPSGGGQYSVTIFNNAAAIYAQLGGADGYVEYYVQAQDGLGHTGQSGSPVITLQYCIG